MDQGRFGETGPVYEQAAAIVYEVLGQNSTEYALAVCNLANLRYVQEKYSEAEDLYRRTLEIMEQQLGPAHEDLVEVTWLAETRFRNQQYDEVEEPFQRAVAILEQERRIGIGAASKPMYAVGPPVLLRRTVQRGRAAVLESFEHS